ncbi:MAG: hypothetical protein ACRDVD_02135, partial [Acidimicrobiia bacterium]
DLAEATVRSGAAIVESAPSGAGHLLGVLVSLLDGPRELAVVGPDAGELAALAWERYRPGLAVAQSQIVGEDVVPLLEGRGRPRETLAYLCRRFVCDAPFNSEEALRLALE